MKFMLSIAAFLVAISASLALPAQLVQVEVEPSPQDLQAEASEWVVSKEQQIVQLEPVNDIKVAEEEGLETAETAHHGGYGGGFGHGGYGGGYGGGFGHGGFGHGGFGHGHGHGGFGHGRGHGGFGGFGGFIGGFGGFGGFGGGHHHHGGWGRR